MEGLLSVDEFVESNKYQFDTVTTKLPDTFVEVNTPDKVGVMAGGYEIINDEYSRFLKYLGVPSGYGKQIPVELMLPHIRHISKLIRPVVEVSVHDEKQIARFGGNASSLALSDFMNSIREVTKSDFVSPQSWVNGQVANVYSVSPTLSTEPKVGDVVAGGLHFSFDKHDESTSASVYLHRLACANGMVGTEALYSWARRRQSFDAFTHLIQGDFDHHVAGYFEIIGKLPHIKVTSLQQLDKLLKEYATHSPISAKLRNRLLEAVMASQVEDMYDVWNALTYESTHGDYTDSDRANMFKFCGRAAEMVSKEKVFCSSCGHNLITHN